MKRKFLFVISTAIALIIVCTTFFVGCAENKIPEDTAPKDYTIQYTDDSGTHQIIVTAGMPYSIEVIPEKYGYTFMGLFDSEVGGTQYISSTGASLSLFTDNKNLILFPQYKAKDFTLILNYQGADVTGNREYKVSYNGRLPELPKNLNLEHKEFIGWYTKENCNGIKVADSYGLIPDKAIINEEIFDLNNKNGFIYLYAGFEGEKHTVIFCYETGMDTKEVQVPYNTPISEVVPDTRVNGQAVLTWSKTPGGEIWNGKVTGDMVLYAKEYAPVIELDTNGGSKVNAVVAREGSIIVLPIPTKDMAKFAYWEDMQGNRFTATIMPSKSLSLKAVWQAMLEFDENGGTEVDDISVEAGNTIELPMPEREGFIFAGWYTDKKEKYTSEIMPADGIRLKAGWWKIELQKKVLIEASNTGGGGSLENYSGYYFKYSPSMSHFCYTLDLTELYDKNITNLNFKVHYFSRAEYAPYIYTYMYWYSEREVSSAYQIWEYNEWHYTTEYEEYTRETEIILTRPLIYICLAAKRPSGGGIGAWWKDFYVEIEYPDMNTLY